MVSCSPLQNRQRVSRTAHFKSCQRFSAELWLGRSNNNTQPPNRFLHFPVPVEEKFSHCLILPPPCFAFWMLFRLSPFCHICCLGITYCILAKKFTFGFVLSEHLFPMFALSPAWIKANCKQNLLWLSFNNALLVSSFIKARFVKLHGHHGLLGCFSF